MNARKLRSHIEVGRNKIPIEKTSSFMTILLHSFFANAGTLLIVSALWAKGQTLADICAPIISYLAAIVLTEAQSKSFAKTLSFVSALFLGQSFCFVSGWILFLFAAALSKVLPQLSHFVVALSTNSMLSIFFGSIPALIFSFLFIHFYYSKK